MIPLVATYITSQIFQRTVKLLSQGNIYWHVECWSCVVVNQISNVSKFYRKNAVQLGQIGSLVLVECVIVINNSQILQGFKHTVLQAVLEFAFSNCSKDREKNNGGKETGGAVDDGHRDRVPVAVVVGGEVGCEDDETSVGHTQGKEDLRTCGQPHLGIVQCFPL